MVPFSNIDPVSHDALYVFQDEIKKRKDFRKECVFTIDPETARVRGVIDWRFLYTPIP